MVRGADYHSAKRAEDPNYNANRARAAREARAQVKMDKEAARARQEEADKQLLAVVRTDVIRRARVRGGYSLVAQLYASNSIAEAHRMEALLQAMADGEEDNLKELHPGFFPEAAASPASPAARLSSPATDLSISPASPSHTHGHGAQSPPASVLREQLRELGEELDEAKGDVARLEQKLEDRDTATDTERELRAAACQESPPLPLPASVVRCRA